MSNANPWAGYGQPQEDDFSDLNSFAGEFTPQHAFRQDLKTVADGSYDCEFVDAKMDRIKGDPIVRTGIRINERVIEHIFWLNKPRSVNEFGADMAALGFPSNTWKNGDFSKAVRDCVALLPGKKFRAQKTTNEGTDKKVYHNLYISGPLKSDVRPMPSPQPQPATVNANGTNSTPSNADCPF